MIIRATWWVLVAASLLLAGYQGYLAIHYAISSNREAVAAVALFGLWGAVFWLPLLAITGWRWQSVGKTHKQVGLGLPLVICVTTIAAFLAAP